MYENLSHYDENVNELRKKIANTFYDLCQNADRHAITTMIQKLEVHELQNMQNLTLRFFEEMQQRFSNGFWLGILVGLSIGTAIAALIQIFHKRLRYILF